MEGLKKWTVRTAIFALIIQGLALIEGIGNALAEGGAFFIGYLFGASITITPLVLILVYISKKGK